MNETFGPPSPAVKLTLHQQYVLYRQVVQLPSLPSGARTNKEIMTYLGNMFLINGQPG